MSSENRQPIKRELIDGKMTIEGEKYPLIQFPIRFTRMSVRDIHYSEGFRWHDGKAIYERRLYGKAKIDRGDTISIAGWGEKTSELDFGLSGLVEGEAGTLPPVPFTIGYLSHDWEIGNPATWYAEGYLAAAQFDPLLAALQAGRLKTLVVTVQANFWIREFDQHAPPSSSVQLFLLPSERFGWSVESGHCQFENIFWSANEPPPEGAAEEPVEEPPTLPIAPTIPAPAPRPTEIRYLLIAIVVLLAVIAFRV